MGMDVCCCPGGAAPLRVLERELQCKVCALAYHTIYLDPSSVGFDDGFDIAESEAKTFYIMQIAGMGAIELLEDAPLGLLAHTDAIVFDTDHEIFWRAVRNDS